MKTAIVPYFRKLSKTERKLVIVLVLQVGKFMNAPSLSSKQSFCGEQRIAQEARPQFCSKFGCFRLTVDCFRFCFCHELTMNFIMAHQKLMFSCVYILNQRLTRYCTISSGTNIYCLNIFCFIKTVQSFNI